MKIFFTSVCLFFFLSSYSNFIDFNVTSNSDSGPGSLRQAILDMNAANIVQGVDVGRISHTYGYSYNIKIYSPLPIIKVPSWVYLNSITIDGGGLPGPGIQSSSDVFNLAASSLNFINFTSNIFYVTDTNSSGGGSLSRILEYASQTSAKDYIYFNIPATAPCQINGIDHNSNYSYNNHFPIVLDGSTQPANWYTGNMPKITLATTSSFDLGGNGDEIYGIRFNTSLSITNLASNTIVGNSSKPNVFLNSSISIQNAPNCTIQNNFIGTDPNSSPGFSGDIIANGLKNLLILNNVIAGSSNPSSCIDIRSDTNTIIKGNKLGTNVAGTAVINNGNKIDGIYGGPSFNLQIGGSNSIDKNVIAGRVYATGNGITIKGNMIGADITGTSNLFCNAAIFLAGRNIILGGIGANEGNVIVGNYPSFYNFGNITIQESKNVQIFNNKIGLSSDGITPLGKSAVNLYITYLCDSIEIGKTLSGYGNSISNTTTGALINYSRQVTIRGNKFFNNSSDAIQLRPGIQYSSYYSEYFGNDNIKRPVVTQLTASLVAGTSYPNATIDLYYSPSTTPYQGNTYIATVTADASGNWIYSGSITSPCLVTCTQTDTQGNTSEFTQGIGGVNNSDFTICKGSSVALQAKGGTSYQWTPSLGLNDPNISNPVAIPTSSIQYKLVINDIASGCMGNYNVNINVIEPYLFGNLSNDTIICPGDSLVLDAKYFNSYVTYNWSTGATTQKIKVGGQTGMYKVTLKDTCGFTVSDSILVTVAPDCGIISGYVFKDINGNCTKDAGESPMVNAIIKTMPGPMYANSDASGFYLIRRPFGSYRVTQIPIKYQTSDCPVSQNYDVTLSSISKIISNQNFGNQIIPGVQDLKVSLSSTLAIVGRILTYFIKYENVGTKTVSGTISLSLDSILNYYSAQLPYLTKIDNTFTWNFSNLLAGANNTIYINMQMPVQPVIAGSTLKAKVIIDPITIDSSKQNNVDSLVQIIFNPCDPNVKEVSPSGKGPNGAILLRDSMLTYTIHFQNTGTAPAKDIIITDTLQSTLNVESIELNASSHPYKFSLSGSGILKFSFKNINLSDSSVSQLLSQGFVSFRIKQNKSNSIGTVISNNANIYFDYNLPIITDTVFNTIVKCIKPIVKANAFSDSICLGDFVNLTSKVIDGDSPYSYNWSPSSTVNNSMIAEPVANPPSFTEYVLEVSEKNGCKNSDTITIYVGSYSIVNLGADKIICMKDTIQIGQASEAAHSYIWSDHQLTSLILISPSKDTNYVLSVLNNFGCLNSDTIQISVNPLPVASAGSDRTICLGGITQFGLPPVNGYSYSWLPNINLNDPNSSSPVYSSLESGTNKYILSVTDQNNCSSKDTISVIVSVCSGVTNFTNKDNSFNVFPNPFTERIKFSYELKEESLVQIDVYNSIGEMIENIVNEKQVKGGYEVNYKGNGSGVYLVRININGNIFSQKIIQK
jgi:hypothetical protein